MKDADVGRLLRLPRQKKFIDFLKQFDGSGEGISLFDVVSNTAWDSIHRHEEIAYPTLEEHGPLVSLSFTGHHPERYVVVDALPLTRNKTDGALRFRDPPSLEIHSHLAECGFNWSLENQKVIASTSFGSYGATRDGSISSSMHFPNRFSPLLRAPRPYEYLEEVGTDWLFAEGPGQISCALFLLVALIEERDGVMAIIQPCPDRKELGRLLKQKFKDLEFDVSDF